MMRLSEAAVATQAQMIGADIEFCCVGTERHPPSIRKVGSTLAGEV